MRIPVLISLMLLSAFGCATRKVDVMRGGRPSQSLEARATRDQGLWTVDLDLPVGRWSVDIPADAIHARVVETQGRPHARWESDSERMTARPFLVRVQGMDIQGQPSGEPFWFELKGRFIGQGVLQGTLKVLNLFGGRIPLHASFDIEISFLDLRTRSTQETG